MNTNLDLIIAHFEEEASYYKKCMEDCSAEYDFDRAKLWKRSWLEAKNSLDILKCFKNPHSRRINHLTRGIKDFEKEYKKRISNTSNFNHEFERRMNEMISKSLSSKIEMYRAEIEDIKDFEPPISEDDDQLLTLLEKLVNKEINEMKLEIKRDRLGLEITKKRGFLMLKFISLNSQPLEHHVYRHLGKKLRNIGFDLSSYTVKIALCKPQYKQRFLQILAVIYFEVFCIFDELGFPCFDESQNKYNERKIRIN